ncbi:DUF3102 domain-containing protein [Halalkalibacterium halodurans]|uniref:DUF3102 domain-containing protein n=1 Tax=Halalkalibacterium halodurans TaxID=86665 RepID=UPI0009FA9706|nr:DUF3102 domain-containing protein [Halalkalibacterium halodurans]TPE68946.1 DUF3102 domain-containing protein [Halalkalibacterium halodurans]
MNQVTNAPPTELSTDLTIITAEINSYKQIAGNAIFEIGRRLKHVKENDLAHGEFGKWLEEKVSFTDRQARRLMQVAEEFKTDDVVRIGSSKIFELIQLPPEIDREQFVTEPHTIPSTGATKTVDEMTVRELREVKRALKEAEREADSLRKQAAKAGQYESVFGDAAIYDTNVTRVTNGDAINDMYRLLSRLRRQ